MSSAAFLNYLHRTYAPPTSDAELLRRFTTNRAEGPFRELVARHGPMVLGLCRRRLGEADADDAFQAVFLTLARRSASIRKPGALAAWLHGVAMRICRNALVARSRRQARNARAVNRAIPDARTELTARELLGVLDDELEHLPERERLPLVLVYWQGLTQAKAAQELGVTPGSLLGRLERGKQRLQRRLVARGFSEADLRMLLVAPVAAAVLPSNLLAQTATLAIGGAAAPVTVAALAAGTTTVKWLMPIAFAVVLTSVGALGLAAAARHPEPAQADGPEPRILAEPAQMATVLAHDARKVNDFQRLTLTADNLADLTGVDVYKFQADVPKGQRFTISLRELDAAGAVVRGGHRYQFEKKSANEQTTIRIGFLGRDRKLKGFLLGDEADAELRIECTGCSPSGLATIISRPLSKLQSTQKTLIVARTLDQARIPGIQGLRLISIVGHEPNQEPKDLKSFPRAEMVLENES